MMWNWRWLASYGRGCANTVPSDQKCPQFQTPLVPLPPQQQGPGRGNAIFCLFLLCFALLCFALLCFALLYCLLLVLSIKSILCSARLWSFGFDGSFEADNVGSSIVSCYFIGLDHFYLFFNYYFISIHSVWLHKFNWFIFII